MQSFLGEYEIAIDSKGRFMLPAGFRKQFADGTGDRFVINRGIENCLTLYPMDVWNALTGKLNKLNDFDPKVRDFKRVFLSGANEIEVDGAGRMLLAKPYLEYTGISKTLVLTAQGNKMEIWDKNTYYKYLSTKSVDFSALAAEVAGGSFFNPFAD